MTITVRPPLYFFPNPRPKWWGTNPDALNPSTNKPLPADVVVTYNRSEGVPPPRKFQSLIPVRVVGPQKPFRHLHDSPLKPKPLPDHVFVNLLATLPTVPPQPLDFFEGVPPKRRQPPYIVAPLRSLPQTASQGANNQHLGLPPPRKLPAPMPVRALAPVTVIIPPTNLAQALHEFESSVLPKKCPPDAPQQLATVLSIIAVSQGAVPRTREYGTKPKWVWPEDAAFPNVASLPPLIGIAQALDDFSPTGLPKKQWYGEPLWPNVVANPKVAAPQVTGRVIQVPWKAKYPWPEDAAFPNVGVLPIFSAATAPGFSYEYPAPAKRFYTIEPAPQDFWALPSLATPPALYDYPAPKAKQWPGDYYPFTNWVQETPPLPAEVSPLMVFEWPKKLILTLDDFQTPIGLAKSEIPTYIPEAGFIIYIPPRTFTIATPVRQFFITVPWRTFTIARDTVQTFDVKDPTESWPLTFNMGPDLFNGETLTGPISVTVTVIQGVDNNPTGIFNGVAGFDQTQTMVVQPVSGGLAGCAYELIVTCPTTNPSKTLTLRGVLPVQIS